jgi:pectate lyase
VLKYGRDTYGPKHTPLFVDGLNIHTHEPAKWKSPKGDVLQATEYNEWILSNFASQQTLMRTLDGLSAITGDSEYRDAAKQATKHVLENLRSPNGLIYWGNRAAYDALADRPNAVYGRYYPAPYGIRHVVKLINPYYELMWEVDPKETRRFIEAFWSAHIFDWSNLNMDRAGRYDHTLEEAWAHEFTPGPVPFEVRDEYGNHSAFFNTGSVLAHAGATLSRLSGEKQPLVWSKRLIQRYVDTRAPNTGISAYSYNDIPPNPPLFPINPFPIRSMDFPEERQVHPWLTVLLTGEMLREDGRPFVQWVVEELTAWGKISYRKKDNSFVPMLIDGTKMEGHVSDRFPKGYNVAEACPAGLQYFWAYSVAYHTTGDPYMWEMVRNIALGNGFGDIGNVPSSTWKHQVETNCSHAYGLLGFLRLYQKTKRPEFLDMARCIADNIVLNKFHKGFFVPSKKHVYTMFDCFEPLALLHFEATINSNEKSVPTVWPTLWKFTARYRFKEDGTDRFVIYNMTESSEPPLSLQEAASTGDLDTIRMLVDDGADVDSLDPCDHLSKTALCRAVVGGHEEIVKFLLAKGADVNFGGVGEPPLHCAVRNGLKTMVELLVEAGADVNAKTGGGKTPTEVVGGRNRKDIIDLLKKHGAATEEPPETVREKWQNMSEEEREKFRERMRTRLKANMQQRQELNREGKLATQSPHDVVHDIAVTNVSAAPSCVQGDTVPVAVNIANKSDQRESFRLILVDAVNGEQIADQEMTLEPQKYKSANAANLTLSPPSSSQGNFGWGINIDGDINRDGYADLLIGGGTSDNARGRVCLYYGGTDMRVDPNTIFEGESEDDYFNRPALGDVNGDGYDDVIIGARGYNNNDGRVYIFFGGIDMDKEADVILDGEQGKAATFSCNCLSAGDVDNDGYADVLVGSYRYDHSRGRAYLYYGGDPMDSSVDVIFEGERADDVFGRNARIGQDIDGDGHRDILIGARTAPEGTRNGRAYLFYGGDRNQMDAVCDMIFTPPIGRPREFGSSLDIYDIDNDGHADVVIGARLGRGAVFIYWGDRRSRMDAVADVIMLGEDGAQSSLGRDKLFCADFNKDGYGDIAVGAYNWPRQTRIGRTYVYYGGTKTSIKTQPEIVFTGETEGSWFGHDIGGGDFNNDGYTDLVAGAWGYNNEGRAYVFYAPFENTTDITFNWNTTGATLGKHVLKASIAPVAGEQDLADNSVTVEVEVKERPGIAGTE